MLHFVQHDSEWMISEVQTDISLPFFCDIARTLMTQKADGDDVGAGDMKTAGLRKGDPTDHK